MTRFYFDVDYGEKKFLDGEGDDIPDMNKVPYEAISLLPELIRDVLPDGDCRVLTIDVRNEDNERIFQATLSLAAEWTAPSRPH